jgi:hypothetical protein
MEEQLRCSVIIILSYVHMIIFSTITNPTKSLLWSLNITSLNSSQEQNQNVRGGQLGHAIAHHYQFMRP